MKIFIVIFIVFFITIKSNNAEEDVNGNTIKIIEMSMDLTIKPCDNFYKHACGNWEFHNQTYQEYFQLINENTNKQMLEIMNKMKSENLKKKPNFVKKLYTYYKSCLKNKDIELKEFMKELAQKENLQLSSKKNNLNWLSTLAVLNKYGLPIFIQDAVYIENQKRTQVHFYKPNFDNEFKILTKDNLLQINDLVLKYSTTEFEKFWLKVSKLEQDINGLQNMKLEVKYILPNYLTTNLLKEFIQLRIQQLGLIEKEVDLFTDIQYLDQMFKIVEQYDSEFLCLYLEIKFQWHLLNQMPEELSTSPEKCLILSRTYLNLPLDWLYEKKYPFLLQEIPRIQEIFNNLIKQYKILFIFNTNNLNTTDLAHLLDKLDNITLKVGQLRLQNNIEKKLENIYSKLNFYEKTLYDNHLQLLKFHALHTTIFPVPAKYPAYTDLKSRFTPYFIALAGYRKEVVVPINMLQTPLYNPKESDVFKYSKLGSILAHEIYHAFNVDQFPNNKKFSRNFECLLKLGTINEKTSDVTGLRVAYETFINLHPDVQKQTLTINGLNLSLDKVFVLSYAQFGCATSWLNSLGSVSHGSYYARTMDTLSHFPKFAEIYGCAKGDHMFLEKPCQLWRK